MNHKNHKSITKLNRVFILEDDIELGFVIENILKSVDSHVTVDWATQAEQATFELKRLAAEGKKLPYDLIVADIFLDGQATGIDFWRTCQDLFPEIPVVITSSMNLDRFYVALGEQCISPPYLQKPFSLIECQQTFKAMINYNQKGA